MFSMGGIKDSKEMCSAPLPLFAADDGSIAGARVFKCTFALKVGGSAIFRTGGSEIRGGGAVARRVGSDLPITGLVVGGSSRLGLGNATIAGFLRPVSTGSGSDSTFFGLRDAATGLVK